MDKDLEHTMAMQNELAAKLRGSRSRVRRAQQHVTATKAEAHTKARKKA